MDAKSRDRIWEGDQTVIPEIKKLAQEKDRAESNAELLSLYMSFFHKQNFIKKMWWSVLMAWHAFALYSMEKDLNHRQIDVLLNFLLKVHQYKNIYETLDRLSDKALVLVKKKYSKALAHEEALAYLNKAGVLATQNDPPAKEIKSLIEKALMMEVLIKSESDKQQAFRQLVRVYHKSSDLFGKINETDLQLNYVRKAYTLAINYGDAPMLAGKIYPKMKELERRDVDENEEFI